MSNPSKIIKHKSEKLSTFSTKKSLFFLQKSIAEASLQLSSEPKNAHLLASLLAL